MSLYSIHLHLDYMFHACHVGANDGISYIVCRRYMLLAVIEVSELVFRTQVCQLHKSSFKCHICDMLLATSSWLDNAAGRKLQLWHHKQCGEAGQATKYICDMQGMKCIVF
jgi:hypothetical protein